MENIRRVKKKTESGYNDTEYGSETLLLLYLSDIEMYGPNKDLF